MRLLFIPSLEPLLNCASIGHSLENERKTRIGIENETHAPATKLVVKRGGDNNISVRSKIVTGTNGSVNLYWPISS